MKGSINVHIEDKIANITFAHPQHNSLPSHLLAELRRQILDMGRNEKVQVI